MARNAIAFHQPLPDAIANAPELHFGLEVYWSAFMSLSWNRPSGFGLMPIPDSAIEDYASRHDLDDDLTESLRHHIRGMDSAFREHHGKKNG